MSVAKTTAVVLGAAALVGSVAFTLLQYQTLSRLREETAVLRQEAAPVTGLRQENERLARANAAAEASSRNERNELLRLRAEVTRLRQQVNELAKAAPAPPPTVTSVRPSPGAPGLASTPTPAAPDGFLPADQWADVGLATPEAAFQTVQWAMRERNFERIQQAMLLPGDAIPAGAQPIGLDMIAASPEGVGGIPLAAGEPSPDQAITTALPELTGSRVVSRQDVSPEEVQLTIENQHADGTRLPGQMTFRRVGDEWKLTPTLIQQ